LRVGRAKKKYWIQLDAPAENETGGKELCLEKRGSKGGNPRQRPGKCCKACEIENQKEKKRGEITGRTRLGGQDLENVIGSGGSSGGGGLRNPFWNKGGSWKRGVCLGMKKIEKDFHRQRLLEQRRKETAKGKKKGADRKNGK